MKRSLLRSIAACSLLAIAAAGYASSRPRYGGTARILLHDKVNSLDPQGDDDHPAARDRITTLLFDTLTDTDALGRLSPRLASSWNSDAGKRVWQFRLRLASFHDGSAVTGPDVAASLARVISGWKITAADRQTVNIETPYPVPALPELLALPRYAVVKRNPDNSLLGSGPYKVSEWQPGERALLAANEDYWGGRAYPDAVEFQLGATLREQLLERQLGPFAGAELTVDQLRALEQSNQNISLSRPSDLLAVVFLQPDDARAGRKPVDRRVREALSNAINRAAISNVILQKKGVPASGILPQWLTGYEFLFPGSTNLERARELRAEAAGLVIITPIALAYDFADPVAKLAAERIALDAREAGIVVQPYGELHLAGKARSSINADAVLLRLPLQSLEPSVALAAAIDDLGLGGATATPLSAVRPEELFEFESRTLENFRVLPVAHISQAVWVGPSAHNWQQYPNGAWALDQLWVEGAR